METLVLKKWVNEGEEEEDRRKETVRREGCQKHEEKMFASMCACACVCIVRVSVCEFCTANDVGFPKQWDRESNPKM